MTKNVLFGNAVQEIALEMQAGKSIAVVGASASGKSLIAKSLSEEIQGALFIFDNFYAVDAIAKAKAFTPWNFDHESLMSYSEAIVAFTTLENGRPARIPNYTFTDAGRQGWKKELLYPGLYGNTVVDGLHARNPRFWNEINRHSKNKVLLAVMQNNPYLQVLRRVIRDVTEGRTSLSKPENVLRQYFETVAPTFQLQVEPFLKDPDFLIQNLFNPLDNLTPNKIQRKFMVTAREFNDIKEAMQVSGLSQQTDSFYLPPEYREIQDLLVLRKKELADGKNEMQAIFKKSTGPGNTLNQPQFVVENAFGLKPVEIGFKLVGQFAKHRLEGSINGVEARLDKMHIGSFLEIVLDADKQLEQIAQIHDKLDHYGVSIQLLGQSVPLTYFEILRSNYPGPV